MPSELTFRFTVNERRQGTPFTVTAIRNGVEVGHIEWSRRSGLILSIEVNEEVRRQGIATALLAHAREVAAATRGVPRPRMSPQRTNDGEAFARSLGERLPRRER